MALFHLVCFLIKLIHKTPKWQFNFYFGILLAMVLITAGSFWFFLVATFMLEV